MVIVKGKKTLEYAGDEYELKTMLIDHELIMRDDKVTCQCGHAGPFHLNRGDANSLCWVKGCDCQDLTDITKQFTDLLQGDDVQYDTAFDVWFAAGLFPADDKEIFRTVWYAAEKHIIAKLVEVANKL